MSLKPSLQIVNTTAIANLEDMEQVLVDSTIVSIIDDIKDVVSSVRRKVVNHITTLLESEKKSRNTLGSDSRLGIKANTI